MKLLDSLGDCFVASLSVCATHFHVPPIRTQVDESTTSCVSSLPSIVIVWFAL